MLKRAIYLHLILLLSSASLFSQDELPAEKIFEKVDNSIVVILSYDKTGEVSQGSGVVVDNIGTIATNHHVCLDAVRIDIKHYSKEIRDVKVIRYDAVKDILLLSSGDNSFNPISRGNSSALKPGQRVYAIGSPEGYENSISEGIVSGFRTDENNVRLIQMTTPITEGSSGGAVVNSRGELVGLSVSGQHEGNLYFAVPVNDVYALLELAPPPPITENPPSINITTANESTKLGEDPASIYKNGEIAEENKNYSDAEKFFSQYLEKFSSDARAYYKRGYARFKLKDYKKAITDFTNVIENGGNSESYFYRGNCYYSIKDYPNAHADYTKAMEFEPDNYDIYYNRGFACYKLNDLNGSLTDWKKAIELNPAYQNELSERIKTVEGELNSKK